jgi:hypothetical protein
MRKALSHDVVAPAVLAPAARPGPAPSGSADIHTLWIGGGLGPLEWLCLHSWIRLGYGVVLHAYEDIPRPPGVAWFDASRLLPAEKLFRNERNGSWAIVADVYRTLLLKNLSVTWLDADIFMVRPLDLSAPNILAKESVNGGANINNAVMKLAPDHPILDEILDRYNNPFKALPWSKAWRVIIKAARFGGLHPSLLPWGALGGLAIQRAISRHGFDGRMLEPEICLTPHRVAIFEPIEDPDAALAEPISYVHLYRSKAHVDLANPMPGSVYSRLWDIVGRDAFASYREARNTRD